MKMNKLKIKRLIGIYKNIKEREIIMEENIFEFAAKNKLRFKYNGWIATEDLYDLDVTQLDEIYKNLKQEEKSYESESLLNKETTKPLVLSVRIDIVKHIVEEKLKREEELRKAAENRAQKNRILEIINRKQDETLQNKSIEELTEMLESL